MKGKIDIVGTGNVGTHLHRAFTKAGFDVNSVNSRSLSDLRSDSDFILISVADDAIESVAANIAELTPDFRGIVAHTSGSTPMDVLASHFKRFGVVYPLQTFNKEVEIADYPSVPIFVEGSDASVAKELTEDCEKIFRNVKELNSESRRKMHLAAVFVCNFTNAMQIIGADLLEGVGQDYELLRPLVAETFGKLKKRHPSECQTGPARRGDMQTVSRHLEAMADDPMLRDIYSRLTDYIVKRFEGK